jgi:hypothetical protein
VASAIEMGIPRLYVYPGTASAKLLGRHDHDPAVATTEIIQDVSLFDFA